MEVNTNQVQEVKSSKFLDKLGYVSFLATLSMMGAILLQIPFIGPLLFLPFLPLSNLYDFLIPGNFSGTGGNVEIGFAWIIFHTWQAWLFYGSFFFLIGLIIGSIRRYLKNKNSYPKTQ